MKAASTLFLLICSWHLNATTPATDVNNNDNYSTLPPSGNANTSSYSCNLITHSGQCRTYQILASAQDSLTELQDGCESMTGIFEQAHCPSTNAIAKCTDIVRNYNQPDVIYDNYYYQVEGLQLHGASLAYVCGELGGDFSQLRQ